MGLEVLDVTPEERAYAIDYAWRIGRLKYRRRHTQRWLNDETDRVRSVSRKVYWESTRRLGKSTELLQRFTENCLKRPGWRAGFFAPVKDGLKDYINPIIEKTFTDCPADLRPYFHESRFILEFPNKSTITFRASNNKQHRLRRGQEFDEAGVDEGRDVDDLDVLIEAVLMPSLFNSPDACCIISSTPADTRSHPLYRYRQQAEAEGWLIRLTIWDALRMDPDVYTKNRIDEWRRETLKSVDGQDVWEREYECKWVVNKSRAAVPEWNTKFQLKLPRDPYYQFYRHYVAIDWGYRDYTAVGFATHLFRQGKLQVEGELTFSGTEVRSDKIAEAIRLQAEKLWGPHPEIIRMVSDSADPILINELNQHAGMSFVPVRKENSLEAMLNQFRVLVNAQKIAVDPVCALTTHCLQNAIWDIKREKLDQDVFARHFDHLMQLVYMCREVDFNTNPIPANYMIDGVRMIELDFDKDRDRSVDAKTLEEAFGSVQRR